jgi:NADPH-dependent F420 reductase
VQQIVAVIGGTGAEGGGLALRFAHAGLKVLIGSRSLDKAQETARAIAAKVSAGEVSGCTNAEAASHATIVVVTVPLAAQAETLKSIRNHLLPSSIVVDATVPLEVAIGGRVSRTLTLWDGSAAQQAARVLGRGIPVVATFHALSADALANLNQAVDCDALMCGDHAEAKATVAELAESIPGVRAVDAGPLENARFLENTAALLIALNLRYKVKHSGIKITGLPAAIA